ncbi:MAG: VOC family protein [Gemmatimonadetes bacterium]|nr:VOC family protein [Gemmatimonadota bacterium]
MPATLDSVQPVLMARDVAASVRFYERLGFRQIFQDDPAEPRYAAVRRDGVEIHLQWHDLSQWAVAIDRPTYRFVASEIDQLYEEFQSDRELVSEIASDSPWAAPAETPWGTREFHVRDPDGNGLHFYRPL